ncbi:uncharacterized protein LOC141651743 [Silene latifolia]|uniref:uncharacterized protein LOC141651743 n=1 Tax=Silene latifolia TaxID=37657 RepID=UPI003D77A9E6
MWIGNEHNKTFRAWFKGRVIEDLQKYPEYISSRLRRLCFGPNTYASSYIGYAINGCTFYTREQDDKSTMQNSGRKRRSKERGRTVLALVSKALKEKKPIELEWDKVHRLPTGTYAGKFSSWVGVTTRRHVSCAVETWDHVDDVTKQEILDSITGAFTVIADRYDWCLIKAGNLWRKWKCTLVRKWLYDETKRNTRTPPTKKYDSITPEDWNVFVASHTTQAFKEISANNKKNACMNRTRFVGSRAGYRGIEVKIKELEKEVEAGTFKPKGREDILAKAIGKPEHGGRVRGVPDGICIIEYFGKAPKKPPP